MPEVIINDQNYAQFVNSPHIGDDGKPRSRGAIPRDFMRCPVGYLPSAKPFDLPLIPESDWQRLLDEQIANKAQLSNIRNTGGPNGGPIPSRDQNGVGYCVTADTEILTEKGWTPYPEYNYSDLAATVNPITGLMEFQRPTAKHVYEYDGEMVYCTNRRSDFGVTPDHRMLVRKWDESKRTLSDQYTFQRAADIGWYAGLMHAPKGFIGTDLERLGIEGDREYLGDDFLAMISIILSDGYVTESEGHTGQVGFCCFNEKRYAMVAALAHRVGFKEVPSRKGVWARYSAHSLAAWIKANCYVGGDFKAASKRVPDLVKCASVRQIDHFLKSFGDQNHSDGSPERYYSNSRRLIDDLQEIILRVGRRGTICHRDARPGHLIDGKPFNANESWELCVSKTERLCIERKKHIEQDHYKGLVYCATVPNGTLITRRNGDVLISGNCWCHSGTSAVLVCRAIANEPYLDLSAFAVGCMIKQYRDEGGWGSEGVEFIADKGIPTSEFWPQRSMSRSNDKPATWENAALHKNLEWMDLAESGTLLKQQLVTCLLLGMPVVTDFNWWSHSVLTIDLVSLNPFKTRIWNSWGDSWSENGTGILEGSKAIPNGALCVRVVSPSQT